MKTKFTNIVVSITLCLITFNAHAQIWLTFGNRRINPDRNFLGTRDSAALVFKTFNRERMRITGTGNVGIGTQAPTQALDVNGNVNLAADAALYTGNQKAFSVNSLNVAIGISALQQGFSYGGNTAVGPAAMGSFNSGASNVAVGSGAMSDMVTGGQNTAVGGAALAEMQTLNNSTALGYFADVSNGSSNATALGFEAFAYQSKPGCYKYRGICRVE